MKSTQRTAVCIVLFLFALGVALAQQVKSDSDHQADPQDLKQAYQAATVVSVTKIPTTGDYAYDVGIRLNCTLYIGRYKSANDVVPLPVNSPVDLRVGKDSIYARVSDQRIEMPLVKSERIGAESCPRQPESASEVIPAGTILPVRLDSALGSDKSQPGEIVKATVMQDVDLGNGTTIRKGSVVTGHVVNATNPGKESDQASLRFQFDQVRFDDQDVPITTAVRALASEHAVFNATPKLTSPDYVNNQVQIGGDEVSYGDGGPVIVGSEVVGKSTSQGVEAHFISDLGSECRGVVDGNSRPQSFWLFSVKACGAYGFDGATISHAGRGDPVGQATVTSNRTLKIAVGSGMLLRVERSGPQEAANTGQRN
jgi:hypothetical protein